MIGETAIHDRVTRRLLGVFLSLVLGIVGFAEGADLSGPSESKSGAGVARKGGAR